MMTKGEANARIAGAVITWVALYVGLFLWWIHSGDKEPTMGTYVLLGGLYLLFGTPIFWTVVTPLVCLLFGIPWGAVEQSMDEAFPEPKKRRRR